FFRAEDGIRVFHVTGVQTCALPISNGRVRAIGSPRPGAKTVTGEPLPVVRVRSGTSGGLTRARTVLRCVRPADRRSRAARDVPRSEERRGGRECRPRVARERTKRRA